MLRTSWYAKTSSLENWQSRHPSAEQCAVSAITMQDYLGGDIKKCVIRGATHYFNVINGVVVDVTRGQCGSLDIDYAASRVKTKDEILRYEDTRRRYELLRARVDALAPARSGWLKSGVPWQHFHIEGMTVVPMFHPSPISPLTAALLIKLGFLPEGSRSL